MKKVSVLLIGMILMAVPFFHGVSGAAPQTATLTLVELGLKDSLVFGNYEIKFTDVDQSWSRVNLEIYESGSRRATAILGYNQVYYYPSQDNPLLQVTVKYIQSYKKSILIEVGSPLKKVETGKQLNEGQTYTPTYLNGKVSIKLVDVTSSSAKFLVTVNGKSYEKVINVGEGSGFTYIISSDISYYPYVYIDVTTVSNNNYAKFDIYIPNYPATTASIKKANSQTPQEETQTTQATPEIVVYNDIMYAGEILKVHVNNTLYKLRLNSVGLYSSFSVFDANNTPLETFQVKSGNYYESKKAPLGVEVVKDSYDTDYNRLTLRLWAPKDSYAEPIKREANVKLLVDTSGKVLRLGDRFVITLRIANEGKGRALGIKLIPPEMSGFKVEAYPKEVSVKQLDAFSEYPLITYVLTPEGVGPYSIGAFKVEYYDEFGNKKTVSTGAVGGVAVYNVPDVKMSVDANYIKLNISETKEATVPVTVSVAKGNPSFEFIKNATIHIELPDGLSTYSTDVSLGDLSAGESITKNLTFTVSDEGAFPVGFKLTYTDVFGGSHEVELPSAVLIDSIQPVVIVKERVETVKVYPEPEELPSYVNQTLMGLDNESRLTLAEELLNVSKAYIPPEPPKTNWWAVFAIIFLIAALGFGAAYYDLKGKYAKALAKLEKRKPKPGGLPKKEEEEEEAQESLS
ncbi:BatD family protein [Palaeococcus ferrophilus]|uniref:BatD family protein n=1 Tax=Palaeococcus ferrophilus TaxID=83868 RepID=UPI00064FDF8C|nr:hypothetical protein [Palaeococcus ferrophilus]